jgi:hypothetical protein
MPAGGINQLETGGTGRGQPPDRARGKNPEAAPDTVTPGLGQEIAWADVIPPEQWAIYKDAVRAARRAKVRFLLGGGFGLAAYTGRWRNTKDMDIYVLPAERERIIKGLTDAGFADYYQTLPYDRGWIYRSVREGIIVDVIWSMANRRAEVDPTWFEHSHTLAIHDEVLRVMPPEELLWCKLYVFQRDHCDWTDGLNLIYAAGPRLDWDRLLARMGDDEPILRSALTLFDWLTPSRSAQLPDSLRSRLCLLPSKPVSPEAEQARIRLLDSRAWFASLQPKDRVLEI